MFRIPGTNNRELVYPKPEAYATHMDYENDITEILDDQSVKTFQHMAESNKQHLTIPRSHQFNRSDVIDAFTDAFHLIGGVPRFATWAHTHPTEYYKLYAKLLPSSAVKQISHSGNVTVLHAVAPGPLDIDSRIELVPADTDTDG